MIAQRTVDDIHACTIGKLHCCRPIILFHHGFRLCVFAPQEPIGSIGGCSDEHSRFIDCHGREYHRTMIDSMEDTLLVHRLGKISKAKLSDLSQGWYHIGIHETAIENGNHHSLAAEAMTVKTVTAQHLQLVVGYTIGIIVDIIPLIEFRMIVRPWFLSFNGIRGCPYLSYVFDKGIFADLLHHVLFLGTNKQGIVPFAFGDHLDTCCQDCLYIVGIQGQVGTVENKVLTFPPFNRPLRKELFRSVERIICAILVFQFNPEHVAFTARIFHPVGTSSHQHRR